ncbi:UDP-N-acetylmuramoyl-L-alanine--D-glutamate ligase, partial [Turicibacter sanguinis]|nr:UDP-N-acetylmuramoyl-L-alanine--D-glutamate ligase [Turicibacter sanguinis]
FKEEWIIDVKDILLKGDHNLQDVLGAVAVSLLYGCDLEAIRTVLKRFAGVKHRLQFVGEIKGVKYYNNSKATNIIATQTALKAFDGPIILIAGGLDRGHDLSGLVPYFNKIKSIVTYGETKHRFKALADEHLMPCTVYDHLDQAVEDAYEQAIAGDIVLFAPACASWDQYQNFEQRGDHFIGLVEGLK